MHNAGGGALLHKALFDQCNPELWHSRGVLDSPVAVVELGVSHGVPIPYQPGSYEQLRVLAWNHQWKGMVAVRLRTLSTSTPSFSPLKILHLEVQSFSQPRIGFSTFSNMSVFYLPKWFQIHSSIVSVDSVQETNNNDDS
jgi:hypothetical protein